MLRSSAILLLCMAFLSTALAMYEKGVLRLDELTLHRVISLNTPVLIRFCKEYEWGHEHEEFKAIAMTIAHSGSPMIVGTFTLHEADHEEKDKLEIAELYDVTYEKLPMYKLFLPNTDTLHPASYAGSLEHDNVLAWAASTTGHFLGPRGTLREFAPLAEQWSEDPSSHRDLLQKAVQLAAMAAPEHKELAELYVSAMRGFIEKGEEHLFEEQDRLFGVAETPSVAYAERQLALAKANVLMSFHKRPGADEGTAHVTPGDEDVPDDASEWWAAVQAQDHNMRDFPHDNHEQFMHDMEQEHSEQEF